MTDPTNGSGWLGLAKSLMANPAIWPWVVIGALLYEFDQIQRQQALLFGALIQRLDALTGAVVALQQTMR